MAAWMQSCADEKAQIGEVTPAASCTHHESARTGTLPVAARARTTPINIAGFITAIISQYHSMRVRMLDREFEIPGQGKA
jgi:hypothetical protein